MKKEILYQGKKIIYHTYGTGKLVMLIHGFGETYDVWKNQIEFLKDKFHLIIPELPGSGSDIIDDRSMEGLAEVIKEIFELEVSQNPPSGGRGAFIGHSMGGYILLALAEKYPELINALGLFHSSAYADSEEKKATRQKGIEFINTYGAFEFIKTSTPNLFSQITKNKNPEFIDEYIRSLNNFSPEALVKYYRAMMQRPDRTEVIRKTKAAVLMVMGKYDVAVPLKDGLEQCHLPEKVYIHILRQSGHLGMLEEPATTNCILEKFLTEN
jgi:pimeloyl-ACP methyl ester carboxylesterase